MHLLADEEASERMTKAEQKFCEGYANVMERCMNSSTCVCLSVCVSSVCGWMRGCVSKVAPQPARRETCGSGRFALVRRPAQARRRAPTSLAPPYFPENEE